MVFKSPEPETAEWASKSLGRAEIDEVKEGFSYGANEMRDGVSVSMHKTLRPLVLDTEILNLNSLEGYLKLSGNVPVAKIALKPKTRKAVAVRFVPQRQREEANTVASEPQLTKLSDNLLAAAPQPEKAGASLPTPWYAAKEEVGVV